MLIISSVDKNGIGQELGLKKGDKILAFSGYEAKDILDYVYYESQDFFTLKVESKGKIFDFEVEKDEFESLGLDFVSDNLEIKTCQNKCVFCFIDQMPKGYRNTLYVKDDDYRQSFLCGNYVTLTNVSDDDIDRIIRLKLSPLYISIHAMDPQVRVKLLNNRFAGKVGEYVDKLNKAGIEMHTQVVVVKGLNDGLILEDTCEKLSQFSSVKSLAVVPCGITEHRDGLYPIDDIDKEYSIKVINQISAFNKKIGRNFVFCADEFYIRAEMETEPAEFYGDFCQRENGVGMLRAFEGEFNSVLEKRSYEKSFLIITGVSAKPFIEKYAKIMEDNVKGLKINVLACENKLFGKTVTCAGLICGVDLLNCALNYTGEYDELCVPRVMLKDGESVFLDDLTISELSKKLGKKVRVIGSYGDEFFESLSSDIIRV